MKFKCCQKRTLPFPCYTEVAVVGSGPSSLFLSYILNGIIPYYSGSCFFDQLNCLESISDVIPNRRLHELLVAKQDSSLLDFSQEQKSFLNLDFDQFVNPLSLIMDKLYRYETYPGQVEKSYINWYKREDLKIPHVVIGKGKIGGGWKNFSKTDGKALSVYPYLELPGYSFESFCIKNNIEIEDSYWRPHRKQVYEYLKEYTQQTGIKDNIYEDSTVEKVYLVTEAFKLGFCACRRTDIDKASYNCDKCIKYKFLIIGNKTCKCSTTPKPFAVCSNFLVLANGINETPKQVEKIEAINKVYYDVKSMIKTVPLNTCSHNQQPVLVIGTGLSAADAIIQLSKLKIPVIHLYYSPKFYKKERNRKKHPLSSYHKSVYPEYYEMFQRMKTKESSERYEAFPDSTIEYVKEASKNHGLTVKINDEYGITHQRKVVCIGIFVGKNSNIDFLQMSLRNIIPRNKNSFLPINKHTYQIQNTENITGVYAIGSLSGDTLIRYIMGGGIGVAANIINRKLDDYKCL